MLFATQNTELREGLARGPGHVRVPHVRKQVGARRRTCARLEDTQNADPIRGTTVFAVYLAIFIVETTGLSVRPSVRPRYVDLTVELTVPHQHPRRWTRPNSGNLSCRGSVPG